MCVTQTAFYKTPDAGMELYSGEAVQDDDEQGARLLHQPRHGRQGAGIVYGEGDGQLRFDPSYMQMVKEKP